ncbi:interferon-induced protein 44-like isoform X2 [Brachyhypopomus gauderio]|uniref:interferon-induced protein 44-like isoform X2 n=1 Tax=Brachyhypopomus gauderio TaxID=698409 RepID=UPI004042C00A
MQPQPYKEFDKPWRKIHWGEKKNLEMKLRRFRVSSQNVRHIRILVVGEIAGGKSSFINSVNNAFQGRITCNALVAAASGTSFTKKFNPANPSTSKDHDRHVPSLGDQTYCLVNIIGADKISRMDNKVIEKIRYIREKATELEMPQVIIMTRVDEACPLVKEDLRKVYTSKKIKEKMQECSNCLGVPMNHIFPVKNYHEEIDTDDDMDILILKALDQIVNIANDALRRSTSSFD